MSLPKIPNVELTRIEFQLATSKASLSEKLLAGIKADSMAPYYRNLCSKYGWKLDTVLAQKMDSDNAKKLEEIEAKLKDATENLGETEISDALLAKAEHFARIGEKELALEAYKVALEKTAPLGHRIDINLAVSRIGFFFRDNELISKQLEKAKTLISEGGDWDRRNRLKVYEAIYLISIRDFKTSVDLFLDTLATFTSTELLEYREFVRYAVLASALTLNRPDFKTKVIHSPEILEVIHEVPHLVDFANSLYNCEYAKFFESLAEMEKNLKTDLALAAHCKYYVREMKILVYTQILDSYRSLTIESMANSFGVTEDYIDADLARFIAAGRLNAVIDKVGGIVVTNRPDAKNAQYQSTIKQGDLLLNRVQNLSRVIHV